ncbi:MAG TPA: aldolase/citrate lyase family protein, partial [Dehalococcoidia bacterium]|nr:aldolase/citrate lyase family protein [Dehalococcoidia bacterium]
MSTTSGVTWDLSAFADQIAQAKAGRERLLRESAALKANLPVKYFRQMAHFTTPASEFGMADKAASQGFAAAPRILSRFNITPQDLASRIGIDPGAIDRVLAGDTHSPLVMIDGEDAQALRDDVVQRGRENAIKLFTESDWGSTLRFYRPSGLNLEYGVEDLFTVLTQVARGRRPEEYPIDGIVYPKVEHPSELEWVCDILAQVERAIGLEENRIRLEFLVESGWALVNLPELTRRCVHRLAGIIFGIADYSADLLLPEIYNDHPVADIARAIIVNVAGAAEVPAIDNMTVNYPVADRSLSDDQNRARILDRLEEVFRDAIHGLKLGMDGKWVGHPLQLFMVMLAYESYL